MLSEFYANGYFVDKDVSLQKHWLSTAADLGYAPAQHALAVLMLNEFDSQDAILLANEADEFEDHRSISGKSSRYELMNLVIELLLSAADGGYPDAYATLGSIYESQGDLEKAYRFYLDGYSAGSTKAANCRGLLYLKGYVSANSLVSKELQAVPTHTIAYEMFILAAKGGCVDACHNAGFCLEKGIGTEININEAIKYYEKGAKWGSAKAMTGLGYLLLQRGIKLVRYARIDSRTSSRVGNLSPSVRSSAALSMSTSSATLGQCAQHLWTPNGSVNGITSPTFHETNTKPSSAPSTTPSTPSEAHAHFRTALGWLQVE